MTALIVGGVVVLLFAMVCALILVLDRRDGGSPRRRELEKMRAERDVARRTLAEVRHVVDAYRDQLDLVGIALVDQVRHVIRRHDLTVLDPENKESEK